MWQAVLLAKLYSELQACIDSLHAEEYTCEAFPVREKKLKRNNHFFLLNLVQLFSLHDKMVVC